ncbi:NADPH oxidase 4 [Verticillium nonalfalfae]|uniref:NADPH oxidase 4 n=1 Tax=Verticillium nonalfalfae TaxID=1051616 RepID=A0A3M9YFQ4_9PEZI|nr:NADPH oxidase 4 [Verticillium nonalfalfae]RNJ59224.1 NADPH oxidase 4 [Verticillium nonalfalfae]
MPLINLSLIKKQFVAEKLTFHVIFWGLHWGVFAYGCFFNVERLQLRPQTAIQIHYTEAGGITGHVMLFCMVMMYTTAHSRIRQQSFETFWYTHHLFIPFFLGLYTHTVGCFIRDTAQPLSPFAKDYYKHCIGYLGWKWELWTGGLYVIERIYREVRARRTTEITRVIRHPYDVIELQFNKPSFRYKAGQWLFLQVPSISKYQWHPFTITSCPHDPYVSIHVRQVGDFTYSLGDAVGVGAGSSQSKLLEDNDPLALFEVVLQMGQQMPNVRIDGPYGAPAEDVFDNEIAVLIGMGIGVTPWASVLKNIWHLRRGPNPPTRLRRIDFVWVCKDTGAFEWFHNLLSSLETQSAEAASRPDGSGFLNIHTYLTQRLDMDTTQNIILNSVGAKLDPLTELKTRTNFGRPNFDSLLSDVRDGVLDRTYPNGLEGRTTVGVYFCGPSAAAREIKAACKSVTVPEVNFRFWKEHF